MRVLDHNVLSQRGAERGRDRHFARRCRLHALSDPLHNIFERRQARNPLAMLKRANHTGYVARAGGHRQGGTAIDERGS